MSNEKSYANTNINWYPGHMAKTKKQIQEDLKLIDVVIELLDARIPISSQNPDIARLSNGHKRIIMLNKSDLADENENKKWIEYFRGKNIFAVQCNANTGTGINEMLKLTENIMQTELQKQAEKGRSGKPIRIIILGIPNIGKSSLINKIAKKNIAKVGNKPGVTKQKQWIRVNNKIELLDTPGVLWPKFGSENIALNLSYTGTIKDENLQITDIAYYLIQTLYNNYPQNLKNRYKLSEIEMQQQNPLFLIETIAKKRGAIKQGNVIDMEKIARIILEDFRSGKLGRITLEKA